MTKYNSLEEWVNSLPTGFIDHYRNALLGDVDAVRSSVIVTIQAYVPSLAENPPDQAEVSAALDQALRARQPPPPPVGEVKRQDQQEQGLSSIDGNNTDAASTSQQTNGSNVVRTKGPVPAAVNHRAAALDKAGNIS